MARVVAALLVASSVLGGCATTEANVVRLQLTGQAIRVDPPAIGGGAIVLRIENLSHETHSLVMLRTARAYDRVALDEADPAALLQANALVARVEVPGGETAELKLGLARGDYVVMCAQPQHYEWGMRAPFRVL